MNDLDNAAFISLFRECFQKCFGYALTTPLSETESKHLGNTIFEDTGLVIGAKSLKNYAAYIFDPAGSKKENPSVATLDTMARYVLLAPYTDEIKRKEKEGNYPFWFRYKSGHAGEDPAVEKKNQIKKTKWPGPLTAVAIAFVVILFLVIRFVQSKKSENFADNFSSCNDTALANRQWWLQSKDNDWWKKRSEIPGCISLFTLPGDSWPDSLHAPNIKNLLLRKINSDCFITEVHLSDFIPKAEWQQAGILLMEDTVFRSKTVRLSIAYNDFFGGFTRPKEIILQGISAGGKDFNQPEEIAHITLFSIPAEAEKLVNKNMQYAALRIEKTGQHYRFLYSASPVKNFAFKEAFAKDLQIKPKYIGLFALQGFVKDTNYIPAHFTFFSISGAACDK